MVLGKQIRYPLKGLIMIEFDGQYVGDCNSRLNIVCITGIHSTNIQCNFMTKILITVYICDGNCYIASVMRPKLQVLRHNTICPDACILSLLD